MRNPAKSESLLFEDRDGDEASFQDIMDEGLDGVYKERIPALVALVERTDSAEHKVLAAALLLAWGQTAGFDWASRWLEHSWEAPWFEASSAADSDQFGANDALPVLVDALRTSLWNDESRNLRSMQTGLLRGLLQSAQRTYLGPYIGLTVARSESLNAELHLDVVSAVDKCLAALGEPRNHGFDLAMQAARLILPLGRTDEEAAARAVRELVSLKPRELVVREVIQSLRGGRGPAITSLLENFSHDGEGLVAVEARQALSQRGN